MVFIKCRSVVGCCGLLLWRQLWSACSYLVVFPSLLNLSELKHSTALFISILLHLQLPRALFHLLYLGSRNTFFPTANEVVASVSIFSCRFFLKEIKSFHSDFVPIGKDVFQFVSGLREHLFAYRRKAACAFLHQHPILCNLKTKVCRGGRRCSCNI